MKKFLLAKAFLISLGSSLLFAQGPSIEWQKRIGGSNTDGASDLQKTSDGGYIIAGNTFSSNGDVTTNHGGNDVWIVKMSALGNIQWQKSYGGSSTEAANSIQQTADGGYIVAGSTSSVDGDVSGYHGGVSDIWVIKLDQSGNIQWQKTYGGSSTEGVSEIRQTTDGGYIIAGRTLSLNGDVTITYGGGDGWIIKTDASGNIQWQKTYGGSSTDNISSIQQTSDGGYIACGNTISTNGQITQSFGGGDYWVIKLDQSGFIQWQKSYGGSATENPSKILQTTDNGYIIAGHSQSTNGQITGNHGGYDAWIVKIDATGNILWQKSYGGANNDYCYDICQTSDGGYAVLGIWGTMISPTTERHDYWITKITSTGDVQWQETFGGAQDDIARAVHQTSDNGYIIAGSTQSFTTDNNDDAWIIKLNSSTLNTSEKELSAKLTVYPNPAKDFVNLKNIPAESVVSIIDISGKKLSGQKYNEKNITINTSQLIEGTYIIRVENKGKTVLSEKLIIKK
ncbi:T9SS type A sorting domain-containing protein [Chryseobacterium sp. MMS23-Vi53]|uniref:T9SS type A sorting domain-containing protein n=1 Tax=Chryseobacterium sp. MMS23-Vi53 TaxID=3386644 RepID=UPI0039ED2797